MAKKERTRTWTTPTIEERLPSKTGLRRYDDYTLPESMRGWLLCAVEIGGCYTCCGPLNAAAGEEAFAKAMKQFGKKWPDYVTLCGSDEDDPLPSANEQTRDTAFSFWKALGAPEIPPTDGLKLRGFRGKSKAGFNRWWSEAEKAYAVRWGRMAEKRAAEA